MAPERPPEGAARWGFTPAEERAPASDAVGVRGFEPPASTSPNVRRSTPEKWSSRVRQWGASHLAGMFVR